MCVGFKGILLDLGYTINLYLQLMNQSVNIEKKNAAEAAVEEVRSGMTVGLGTGSTAYYAIKKIGDKLSGGQLTGIKAVASSDATRKLAGELNIKVVPINEVSTIDLTIDGADEFDPALNLIKGGGGALLQEKIIAYLSKRFLVITDASKQVPHLGGFKLPLEVMTIAHKPIMKLLHDKDYRPALRQSTTGGVFITDNQNVIIDCDLEYIKDPVNLSLSLSQIPGVIETGLFLGMTTTLYMGKGSEVVRLS